MIETKAKVLGTVASVALLLGTVGNACAEPSSSGAEQGNTGSTTVKVNESSATEDIEESNVEGTFAATQDVVTPTDEIARSFRVAFSALCGNTLHEEAAADGMAADASDWKISVSGDVDNSFSATLGDLSRNGGSQTSIMGCTCAGNRAGGRATANAQVTGVDLRSIIALAGPSSNANAVTFVSGDGTAVTMPLWYLYVHPTLLAYEINGAPLSESMGGTVQLWAGEASANYFVRDVVLIRITSEEKTPDAPGADMEYANRPNVTVLAGA